MNEQYKCETPCKATDKEFGEIWTCLRGKVTQRLFFWVVGALAFFSVVVIGGSLWEIRDDLGLIKTELAVIRAQAQMNEAKWTQELNLLNVRIERLQQEVRENREYRLRRDGGRLLWRGGEDEKTDR